MRMTAILLAILTLPLAADEVPHDLDKIEAALKSAPDDPLLHFEKCQALFAKGKEQEALDHAAITLQKFKAAKNNLAWMRLGWIKTKTHQLDVRFNMSAAERAEKKDGIVRPYSFHIWTTTGEPKLVHILDFELAYLDGEVVSAAIGETTEDGHANFGIVDEKSDFATIKKKVLKIVGE